MAKSKTPSFVLILKLNTNRRDDKILNDRFFAAFLMTNTLVKHVRKRLAGLRQDKRYHALIEERRPFKGKKDKASKHRLSEVNEALKTLRMEYGLSEYQFHAWIVEQQHRFAKYIDADTAQKIATHVWQSVESVLFLKGKTIHFKRLDDIFSLEGKSARSAMHMKDGRLHWKGLVIQPQIRKGDTYAREALCGRIKYCRIVRKPMGETYHYYIQLVIEGLPPKKHQFLPGGLVGIDQGTSTEAVVSENGCLLTELAADSPDITKRARRIQKRMNRSRRASNPDNYNPDGTVKKHPHKFVKTKRYKHDHMRLKMLHRRRSDSARQAAERFANTILEDYGSDIVTEKMNYKALQAKAKADTINPKTGKHRKRGRFGKTILNHAPARFLRILNRKLGYLGKEAFLVDTFSYRASQFHHDTGEYIPPGLCARTKVIDGHLVQRDLYSAFLLMCALDETIPDPKLCSALFPKFLADMENELRRLLLDSHLYPSCMGLKNFRYLLAM